MLALPPPGPYRGISTLDELAYQLGVTRQELCKWAFRKGRDSRYIEFKIPKRKGGHREIQAPKRPLLLILRRLLELHGALDTFSAAVHGFRRGHSIVMNAQPHVHKRLLYKADIEDFFPTITYKRLKHLLMHPPFAYPIDVAIVIAKLCTFRGRLPQGSPMSPFLSNVFLRKTDSVLRQFAKSNRLSYTRYADDISFSTTSLIFPESLVPSDPKLKSIVERTVETAGFAVNAGKTRLIGRKSRMCVTGVVVNRKLNVSRSYIRRIRVLIYLIKKLGLEKANEHFLKEIDERASSRVDRANALRQVVTGRIAHVSNVRGADDLLVRKLKDQLAEALTPGSTSRLGDLRRRWVEMKAEPSGQARGYLLERIWSDLADIEGIKVHSSFRVTGEQIDGAIEVSGEVFLVECKAGSKASPMRDIDTFAGKLNRRPVGTLGLFLSIEGYADQVPMLMKEFRDKQILLMTATEIEAVLSEKRTLSNLVTERVRDFLTKRIVIRDPYSP